MNENKIDELMSKNIAPSDAQLREQKILAIKNSLKKSCMADESVPSNAEKFHADSNANYETYEGEASAAPAWDNDIADKIAKRVQQVKSKKFDETNSAESLIRQIDMILASHDSEIAEDNTINNEVIQENALSDEHEMPRITESENELVCNDADKPDDEVVNEVQDAPGVVRSDEPEKEEVKTKKKKKKKKKTFGTFFLGLLPNKQDRLGERIRKIVFLGSVAAVIVCGYIVADYYIGNYLTESRYKDVMDMYSAYKTEPTTPKPNNDKEYDGPIYNLLPGAQKLLDINKEIVGVISIPGTEVNYPIVQADNHDKYLNRDIMGKEAKAGAIFLDYRCRFDKVENGKLVEPNTDNQIIYGHNMADKMMFGSLRNYKEYDYYYGDHPIIELNSNYQTYVYKIFAFFIVDANDKTETAFDCWNNINFSGEEDFYNFVNEAKRRTMRLNDVDVKYGDKLLTLSTCNSIFGEGSGGRLIVLAREVRAGEDPYEGTQNSTANKNIKWPSLYYKYRNEKYDPDAEFIPYGGSADKDKTNAEE